MVRKVLKSLFVALLWPSVVHAAPEDYGYKEGSWVVSMQMANEAGNLVPLQQQGFVTGKYLEDKKTFLTVFTMENGFHSTNLAAYDTAEGQWRNYFINANAQRFQQFTSKFESGSMVTVLPGGYSGKEPHTVRAVETPVEGGGFTNEVFHQQNGSDDWRLVYRMTYTPQQKETP